MRESAPLNTPNVSSERRSQTHLRPPGSVEKHIGGLEIAVDGPLAVEERHARTDISDDPPGPLLKERLFRVLQQRAEVPAHEQLHDEDQAVRQRRNGSVDVHRVRAPETNHGVQFAQKRFPLAALLPELGLTSLSAV